VCTRLSLQALPMNAAADASAPAAATITTRSPLEIVSTSSRLRLATAEAGKKLTPFHDRSDSLTSTSSQLGSSATTLTTRATDAGAGTRNRASAAELIRADSLNIRL
jgi:hypothetical protein